MEFSCLLNPTIPSMESIRTGLWQLSLDATILAQQTDADLVENFKESFRNFIESGQVWAFVIGLIIGYFVRMFTTYGG